MELGLEVGGFVAADNIPDKIIETPDKIKDQPIIFLLLYTCTGIINMSIFLHRCLFKSEQGFFQTFNASQKIYYYKICPCTVNSLIK